MGYFSELHAQLGIERHEWSADRFGAAPIRLDDIEETTPPADPTRDGIVSAVEAGLLDFGDLADYDRWLRDQGRLVPCPACDGTGRDIRGIGDWDPCAPCGGSGEVEP